MERGEINGGKRRRIDVSIMGRGKGERGRGDVSVMGRGDGEE